MGCFHGNDVGASLEILRIREDGAGRINLIKKLG